MYEGLKKVLRLLNLSCERNGCSDKCPVYDECDRDLWDLLKEDLKQLEIKLEEVNLPE